MNKYSNRALGGRRFRELIEGGVMSKRLTAIAPAGFAACVVTLCVAAGLLTVQPAQSEGSCLSGPNATAPEGRHLYYRVDRASGRHCWYLAEKGKRTPEAAPRTKRRAVTAASSTTA